MNETILTLGVVFVATAIVGGGVSLMNNKMPVVDSPAGRSSSEASAF
jgi:hypothetical protein